MSRDFLISFASANDLRAVKLMGASELQSSGEKLLQIDVRERSIFVKVAYTNLQTRAWNSPHW